jgi:shikimate kinase
MSKGTGRRSTVASSPPDAAVVGTRRVVLVGFMAAGKSQVGSRLAERLGWRHVDLDREIEARAETSIETIFAERGEAAFRALEARVTPAVVAQDRVVVSTGGGWVTNPGLFDALPQDTLTVWLQVSPEEVLRRITGEEDQPVRPLLRAADPRSRVEELLASRAAMYARAAIAIDTDGRSTDDIADAIERIVRERPSATHSPSSSGQNGS